jgi:hypothetical protein
VDSIIAELTTEALKSLKLKGRPNVILYANAKLVFNLLDVNNLLLNTTKIITYKDLRC